MESIGLVDAVVAGDKDTFAQAFAAAMATKVSDALEIKKVEVASNLLNAVEVEHEPTEVETEVSGTDAELSSDQQSN